MRRSHEPAHPGAYRESPAVRADEREGYAGPEVGRLLYSLVRAMRPALVVGFGGAAGTVAQLAAGARANGSGRVTGFVPDASGAAGTRAGLASAGLARWAEITEADVDALGRAPAGTPYTVDLVLLDCRPDRTLPALTVLEPRMRPGTVVIAVGPALTAPYLDRVRDGGGYLSVALPVGAGLEASTRLRPPAGGTRTALSTTTAPGRELPGPLTHLDS
jgi:long-chain acyl-CoA synthetase